MRHICTRCKTNVDSLGFGCRRVEVCLSIASVHSFVLSALTSRFSKWASNSVFSAVPSFSSVNCTQEKKRFIISTTDIYIYTSNLIYIYIVNSHKASCIHPTDSASSLSHPFFHSFKNFSEISCTKQTDLRDIFRSNKCKCRQANKVLFYLEISVIFNFRFDENQTKPLLAKTTISMNFWFQQPIIGALVQVFFLSISCFSWKESSSRAFFFLTKMLDGDMSF